MSGSDYIFNISKGKEAQYASLPLTNDALIVMLCKNTNTTETDAVCKDYDDFGSLLAGPTDEISATNYARKTVTAVTTNVDDTADQVTMDIADQVWTALGGTTNDAGTKMFIGYDNDTTSGTDSNIVPISAHTLDFTTDGSDFTVVINNYAIAS